MENNQVSPQNGQLPSMNPANSGRGVAAPNGVAPVQNVQLSAAQQAQQILANGSLGPYQMTQQFNELKSQYLQGHGVRIGD